MPYLRYHYESETYGIWAGNSKTFIWLIPDNEFEDTIRPQSTSYLIWYITTRFLDIKFLKARVYKIDIDIMIKIY